MSWLQSAVEGRAVNCQKGRGGLETRQCHSMLPMLTIHEGEEREREIESIGLSEKGMR